MREMKRTMAAVLSLTLACTLLIAPAEGQAAKKKMKLNKTKATLYVGKKLTLKVKNTKKKGFTLTELMVVLVIIAIIAAIAVPSFIKYWRIAEFHHRRSDRVRV